MHDMLPQPVLFNCWKHHAGFVLSQIDQLRHTADQPHLMQLVAQLKVIGNSQMDVYTGTWSPQAIAQLLLDTLHKQELVQPQPYHAWLEATDGYRVLDLGAASCWVLRWGEQPERYVHIHPARYAPNTVRVRAPLLKVAIATLAWVQVYGGNPFEPAVVNTVRQRLFELAPLHVLTPDYGLGQLITLLHALSAQFFPQQKHD